MQGFRERLLADPKFLNRLAIEEAISITTAVIAQYEKRKGRFFDEIDYVLTDTIRGSVVDFFTVWLPAPTISLLSIADNGSGESLERVRGLLGSLPDNAFQKGILGQNWDTNQRIASVLIGGSTPSGNVTSADQGHRHTSGAIRLHPRTKLDATTGGATPTSSF